MPRVAVTGASGKLGRALVRELHAHGWTVHNFDLAAPAEPVGTFTRIEWDPALQITGLRILNFEPRHSWRDQAGP
jgi:nucleoside-diphosphate-sugar epimerase